MHLTRKLVTEKRNSYFPTLVLSLFFGIAEAAPRAAPARPPAKPAADKPTDERPTTLVDDEDKLGWMVAPSLGYASIRSNGGLLVGAKGGVILNHRLVLGAAGYGYVPDAFGGTSAGNADFAYGGAYLEYIFMPRNLFHFSASVVAGGGTANNDFVLVANPAVNAILNLSPRVHLGAELAYRAVTVLASNRPNSGWFAGPSFSLFVQFGNF